MKNRKKNGPPISVSGLANIGKLMEKVPQVRVNTEPPKGTKEAIVAKTVKGMPNHLDPFNKNTVDRVTELVAAAVREGYNLGHAHGIAQAEAVEALVSKKFDEKARLTMPAVVAAVMEHLGMTDLALDLNDVATVFARTRIDYTVVGDEGVIAYTLRHNADDDGAGDKSFSLPA